MLSSYRSIEHCSKSFIDETGYMLPLAHIPKSASHESGNVRKRFWEPAVEIYENANQLIVTVELPGIEPQLVHVDISDHCLVIQSNPAENWDRKQREIASKSGSDTFTRSIALPVPVDKSDVKSTHVNGILTLHLPKAIPSIPKSIKVHFEN